MSRAPLLCPQRSIEEERIAAGYVHQSFTCTGIRAKSNAEIRHHLKRSPHLIFIELCPTCNEQFLDKHVFECNHGYRGELCRNPQPQLRGEAKQLLQWRQLRDMLHTRSKVSYFLAQEYSHLTRLSSLRTSLINGTKTPHLDPWILINQARVRKFQ